MRRAFREWGWMALGFALCLGLVGVGAFVWGQQTERRIGRVTVQSPKSRAPYAAARPDQGGDALQPASAGQQPEPAGEPAPGGGGDKGDKQHDQRGTTPVTPNEPKQPAQAPASPAAEAVPAPTPPPTKEEPEPQPAPERGLIGNPGGIVGDVVCQVNELGIRVCTESG